MCITMLFDWFNDECLILFSNSQEETVNKNDIKNELIVTQPKSVEDHTWDIL
jgi:hypothetical protein